MHTNYDTTRAMVADHQDRLRRQAEKDRIRRLVRASRRRRDDDGTTTTAA